MVVEEEYAKREMAANPDKGVCEHFICAPCAMTLMANAQVRVPNETTGKSPKRGLSCPTCRAPGKEYVRVIEQGLVTVGQLRKAWVGLGYFTPK
jgi:hypothetical protein